MKCFGMFSSSSGVGLPASAPRRASELSISEVEVDDSSCDVWDSSSAGF